jgi:hypothetical protein
MSHHDMHADKTIHLNMTEIKELNFRLEAAVQEISQQEERTESMSEKSMLREKVEFLEQIINKLNH